MSLRHLLLQIMIPGRSESVSSLGTPFDKLESFPSGTSVFLSTYKGTLMSTRLPLLCRMFAVRVLYHQLCPLYPSLPPSPLTPPRSLIPRLKGKLKLTGTSREDS